MKHDPLPASAISPHVLDQLFQFRCCQCGEALGRHGLFGVYVALRELVYSTVFMALGVGVVLVAIAAALVMFVVMADMVGIRP